MIAAIPRTSVIGCASGSLRNHVLMKVISLSALCFLMRVETELESDDTFDDGLGMVRDHLREQFIGVRVASDGQERFEQGIDLDRELLHIVRRLSVI